MTFRARLSLFALESRENPSGPVLLDPVGGPSPPQDPNDPGLIGGDTGGGIGGDTGGETGGNTSNPLLDNNDIFNTPLVP